jgi:hypothetical protein
MSANFYKYIYNRQNYRRFRDIALTEPCTSQSQFDLIMQQIDAWRQWEITYRENRENGLPAPPYPDPIEFNPAAVPSEEIDECKQAYINLHKKSSMNSNSNRVSTNMRIGYLMNNQYRLPIETVWY